jgi:NhaC family Na+:H+ antiporter
MCAMIAALIALKNGHTWEEVQVAGQGALSSITSAVFILLAVGALIGVWNLSGTIPTLVYYGIQILSADWYYAATALICGAVAMSIGSSWTTAGTIGVGLVGIATMLGVSPAITAGAVISGAYLGDKLSPLSETTVLTAQMVQVDVHEHIKRQAWTSVPAFVIALLVFFALGFVVGPELDDTVSTTIELASIGDIYRITPLNLLPLVLLAYLSIRKVPASLSLTFAALFAGVLGAFLQPQVMADFVAGSGGPVIESIKGIWRAMANGFSIDSGIGEIDRLLSRGGMDSMLLTLWLIVGAVTFGALLEAFGLIARLIDPLIAAARSTGRLFATVFACGFGLNVVAGDQYIALVLPSKVFRAEFGKRGLAPTNLSRLAADSGTVTSPLVPWNSCGAFMAAVLGVSTLLYVPYAVFCYASPALSVLYGFTGFKIEQTRSAEVARLREAPQA